MINEIYGLSVALRNKSITTEEWCGEYKPIPKGTSKFPCIRIWIADDGTVCNFESISADHAQLLRKYGNNQNAFPAFNIVPLYRITNEKQLLELKDIEIDNTKLDLDKIKSWCTSNNWKKSVVKKVYRSLHDVPQNLFKLIGIQEQSECNSITKLALLTENFSNDSTNNFRESLEKCILIKLQKKEDINLALSMLFQKGEKDNSLSAILDIHNWQSYEYPVACKDTTVWLNDMLLATNSAETPVQVENNRIDAFGTPFVNPCKTMDSVKLSGFEVTLRTMFNGQPCQYRYKEIDDGSYPISLMNRSQIKKSLEWIADSDKEGIMWRKVDKNEIIFAYPSNLPEVPLRFASIFGSSASASSEKIEARFESVMKEFIKVFSGIPTHEKPEFIQIFTIRKMDKARAKVIFTHNSSSEQFVQAAEDWVSGCNNLPKTGLGECETPFPLQVARIVNNVWKQNGELAQGKNVVERMKHYQGMELLLNSMQESMIHNFLHILLTNSSGLVNYIGNWIHGGLKYKDKKEEKKLETLKKESTWALSVLGLFLYKYNERKEKYMENMAYLIGQLLHISDELHTMYCTVVRKNGEVPPQLAGSALFITAGETPNQAISQLSVRMNPYIAWAKQYRYKNIVDKGKESWRAGWYLKLYEDTANSLILIMKDTTRFSNFEKAQLFIGYLASFPKREVSNTTANNDENNIGGTDNEQ